MTDRNTEIERMLDNMLAAKNSISNANIYLVSIEKALNRLQKDPWEDEEAALQAEAVEKASKVRLCLERICKSRVSRNAKVPGIVVELNLVRDNENSISWSGTTFEATWEFDVSVSKVKLQGTTKITFGSWRAASDRVIAEELLEEMKRQVGRIEATIVR